MINKREQVVRCAGESILYAAPRQSEMLPCGPCEIYLFTPGIPPLGQNSECEVVPYSTACRKSCVKIKLRKLTFGRKRQRECLMSQSA